MAAITAAENGSNEVILIEKNKSLGKKLLITGKGRCNITNSTEMDEFFSNIPRNNKFLYSVFNNYNNTDIIDFLHKQGVETKVERGKRIFPVSDKANDVLNAFVRRMKELQIKIKTEYKVEKIIIENGQAVGVDNIPADKIILATGGISYPGTGSTGDGHKIAERLGHTITALEPSLVPLIVSKKDLWMCKEAEGLSLKNIKIKIEDVAETNTRRKKIYEELGEMIFTDMGVSGPVILTASAYMRGRKEVQLSIDLKPALSQEQLDVRILRDFEEVNNKQFKNALDKLLPQKLIPIIIKISEIDPQKKVNEITKEERLNLIKLLKGLELEVVGLGKIRRGNSNCTEE